MVLTVGGVEVQALTLSPLRADAVGVNPEPKAHVRVEQQVHDGTTRDVGVLISVAVGELNEHNAKGRRDLHEGNSVRGTRLDTEEHVKQSNVNDGSMMTQ